MNKKLIFSILLIIIVLGAGAILVSFNKNREQNQNLSITDWKTYKNEKYGFDFKYPSNWIIENGDISDTGVGVWSSKARKQEQEYLDANGLLGGSNGPDFSASYCDEVCSEQIRKDWTSYKDTTNIPIQDIFRDRYAGSFKEIIAGSKKAYEWTEVSSIDRYVTYIPTLHGGYFLSAPQNDPKIIVMTKDIISTFKITK